MAKRTFRKYPSSYIRASHIQYRDDGSILSVDGWDTRTGLIRRIDKYLYENPDVEPPNGYIPYNSRAYESLKTMYGNYVTTPFHKVSYDELIRYAEEHNILDDKWYVRR